MKMTLLYNYSSKCVCLYSNIIFPDSYQQDSVLIESENQTIFSPKLSFVVFHVNKLVIQGSSCETAHTCVMALKQHRLTNIITTLNNIKSSLILLFYSKTEEAKTGFLQVIRVVGSLN